MFISLVYSGHCQLDTSHGRKLHALFTKKKKKLVARWFFQSHLILFQDHTCLFCVWDFQDTPCNRGIKNSTTFHHLPGIICDFFTLSILWENAFQARIFQACTRWPLMFLYLKYWTLNFWCYDDISLQKQPIFPNKGLKLWCPDHQICLLSSLKKDVEI